MNWSQGLFRAWVGLSGLWVAFLFLVASWARSTHTTPRPLSLDDLAMFGAVCAIPPLILFAVGYVLLWVGRGFSRG